MVSLLVHTLLPLCLLLWTVTPSFSDTCADYRGFPGVPGIPGAHGINGKDGIKGEKGDPGEDTQLAQGPKGDQGILGYPGRIGLKGDEGMHGDPGPKGKKGPKGALVDVPEDKRSFFSYKKTSSKLTFTSNKLIDFGTSISPENPGDALSDGEFTAKLSGIYFFVYHITASQNGCLSIKKGIKVLVNLCDTSSGVLVTSGSVVVDLKTGEKVSIYTSRTSQIISKDADSIFTGFLLFPS